MKKYPEALSVLVFLVIRSFKMRELTLLVRRSSFDGMKLHVMQKWENIEKKNILTK